jgi:hypothetical protein
MTGACATFERPGAVAAVEFAPNRAVALAGKTIHAALARLE